MNNPTHSGLPIPERKLIKRQAKQLLSRLQHYFKPYPDFDQVRFPATALASVAENPLLPLEVLLDMAKVTVWIFTIDAVIDEKKMPEPELRQRLAFYEEIIRGERSDSEASDPYAAVLLHLTRLIQSKPLYPVLKGKWEEAYHLMIQGMLHEAYAETDPTTFDQYLERGIYSIGLPLYVISSWILQSGERQLDRLDALERVLRLSGACVRLANDLRTFEKERLEHNVNAVFIKEKEFLREGLDNEQALHASLVYISDQLKAYLEDFLALADEPIPFVVPLKRLTLFAVDFYSVNDFHTLSASQLNTL